MRYYWGQRPLTTDRPFMVAELEPEIPGEDATFELWVRGRLCQGPLVALKLVAKGPARNKGNYWLTWHCKGKNLVNRGRDVRLLKAGRPGLYDAVTAVMVRLQGRAETVSEFIPALREAILRGGSNPPLIGGYASGPETGAVQAKIGPRGGSGPLLYNEGAKPSRADRALGNLAPSQKWTGVPCEKGHLAPRRIRDGECVECRRLANREYRARRRAELEELL